MRKPFKVAAYSLLISLILGALIGFVISPFIPLDYGNWTLISSITLIYLVFGSALAVIAVYGFISLGKKLNNRFLTIASWIGIIVLAIYFLFMLLGGFFLNLPELTEEGLDTESEEGTQEIYNIVIFIFLVHVIFSIIWGAYGILFGIALLKVRKKIKYAKAAGILNIISGATFIIFVGYIILYAAIILEIVLLFEASKRFESKRRKK